MKILICVPTFDQNIHAALLGRILQWNATHYIGFMPALGLQPVDHARNWLVDEFMKTDCTHMMFIDADTIPPHDALDKLVALKTPFASGLTPIINGNNHSITKYNAVGEDDKEIKPDTGIHRSRGVGASCMLISREVFEKVGKPYFRFLFEDDNKKPCYVSEDIFFISKCLQKDIIPMVDSSIVCQHVKKSFY